jgi:hypothetical protein
VKTAHLLCPSTDAFLVPKLSFLANLPCNHSVRKSRLIRDQEVRSLNLRAPINSFNNLQVVDAKQAVHLPFQSAFC